MRMSEPFPSPYWANDKQTQATIEVARALTASHGIIYAAIFISEYREAIARAAKYCSRRGVVPPVMVPTQATSRHLVVGK